MRVLLAVIMIAAAVSGCAEMPMKDGRIAIGKDTTLGARDGTVAEVSNRF
jgi:hypothetical protein